tara:strand:+ start:776 stop:928 length:153 start_codon:yes stop_codon:yes gene_type:complete
MADNIIDPEEKKRLNRQHQHALKIAYIKRQDRKTLQQSKEEVVEKITSNK